MTKTFRALRMEDEKEDFSWALALDDSERLEIATRLVSDLWSAAHNGSPFPPMDRTVYSYIPVDDLQDWTSDWCRKRDRSGALR